MSRTSQPKDTISKSAILHRPTREASSSVIKQKHAYRQTVLTAMQQTEDALASQRLLAQQIEQQKGVIDSAQKNYDLANLLYRNGVDSYLDVFVAEITLLSQKQTGVSLRVQLMASNVQLIEAIGGGWNADQLTLPSESVSHK